MKDPYWMRAKLCRLASVTLGMIGLAVVGLVTQAPARTTNFDTTSSHSLLGNYLAGRFARTQRDTASAAKFYEQALARDPKNEVLLEQAFQMEALDGNWNHAIPLAERLVAVQPNNRMAHFLLGVAAFKDRDYKKADAEFKAASENPIGELTAAIARGWTKLAAGNKAGALKSVDLPKQPEWAQFYLRYHRALMADIIGKRSIANDAYAKMFRQDSRTLRTSLAYARHAAHFSNKRLARLILRKQYDKSQTDPHPLVKEMMSELGRNSRIPLLITTPAEGLAEVFYGLGEALTGEGGISLGTLYLQLALYTKPDHAFALAALASAEETSRQYAQAIETYDKIPKGSALQDAIDIRKAFNLNSLDRVDEAKTILESLAKKDPKDIRPLEALGNIARSRKDYDDAIKYFSRVIELIGNPKERDWGYYYARGTSYERVKNWPAAEKDLKRALALSPDQPLVLNYLGYSWIDQGRNMKQGMKLIEKAVQLKPDDGYIVDSLGWAHYKQGNYKDAVKYLERAVEIKPDDPTLNDHLGDAYWHVGREREARFQWGQALTLDPEPDAAAKIKSKLENGLPMKAQVNSLKKSRQVKQVDTGRRHSENKASAPRAVD